MELCYIWISILTILATSTGEGLNNTLMRLQLKEFDWREFQDEDCDVEIVSRDKWGARTPKGVTILDHPVENAFIFHTVGDTCHDIPSCSSVMRAIQDLHMDSKGWYDIAYSFVVGNDGRIYEGRGWNFAGAACRIFNPISIEVAFMGYFMYEPPPVTMVQAAYNLLGCGLSKGIFTEDYQVHGHRDATCTLSPGDELYRIIKEWPRFVGKPLSRYYC